MCATLVAHMVDLGCFGHILMRFSTTAHIFFNAITSFEHLQPAYSDSWSLRPSRISRMSMIS